LESWLGLGMHVRFSGGRRTWGVQGGCSQSVLVRANHQSEKDDKWKMQPYE
jgi:hypothetical protein